MCQPHVDGIMQAHFVIEAPNRYAPIARVYSETQNLTTTKEHAHLIAAAPDLLAACEAFVQKVETGKARSTESYNQMKAVIAKAKGIK